MTKPTLNFILGGSKSGKSYSIFEKVKILSEKFADNDDYNSQPIILIVPEQYTFETERAIYQLVGERASLNINVTSFSRLSRKVFQEYGGIAGTYADDCTKIVLMSNAIDKTVDELNIYKNSSKYLNLTTKMISAINELKMSGITAQDLVNTDIKENDLLKSKIKEISTIYENYELELAEKNHIDLTDDLARAIKKIEENQNEYINGKYIFIDAFKGFTNIEYKFIKNMIANAQEVTISLAIDNHRSEKGQLSPFASIINTQNDILALAKDIPTEVKINTVELLDTYYQNDILKHLEKNIFSHMNTKFTPADAELDICDTISITECSDEFEELEFVLSTIKNLIVTNEYQYKDIAIISRDTSLYENIYEILFDRYNVPVFFDKVVSVTQQALIRFVQAFLNCVIRGATTENILAMLKCELIPFSFYEISNFENYIFTWNITKAKDWTTEFKQSINGFGTYNNTVIPDNLDDLPPDERKKIDEELEKLAKLNEIRAYCIDNIKAFKKKIKDASGIDISRAIMDIVNDMDITKSLESEIKENADDIDKINEINRVWDIFNELLSTLGNSIGKSNITVAKYNDLFSLIAETYDMGNIQQSLDCVILGSADRIRINNRKVVFVLSVNDGYFPQTPVNNSLLSSKERDTLSKLELPLPKIGIDKVKEERYISYSTLTSPTQKLYISYLKAISKGDLLQPAPIIADLTEMFTESITQTTSELPANYFCHSNATTLRHYLLNPNAKKNVKASIKKVLEDNPITNGQLKILDNIKAQKGFIITNKDIAIKLFNENMRISSTQIESYMKCPFMYFCQYGIKAKMLKKLEINPINSGDLIHKVLDNIISSEEFKSTIRKDTPIPIENTSIKSDILNQINKFIDTELGGNQNKTERFLYLCTRRQNSIYNIVERLHDEFKNSEFVPILHEATIGNGENDDFNPLVITREDGKTVTVTGKIDRVDCYTNPNRDKYIRIIDYKSGKTVFDLNDVLNGLSHQMLIYLQATTKGGKGELKDSKPAGILYMCVGELSAKTSDINDPKKIKNNYFDLYQMNGLIVNEPEDMIQAMEKTDGKSYKFIPNIKQNKGPINKFLVTADQLGNINKYINLQIEGMSLDLHAGEIPAFPLKNKDKALPCSFCDYSSVCGTNTLSQENLRQYNLISNNNKLREAFDLENKKENATDTDTDTATDTEQLNNKEDK